MKQEPGCVLGILAVHGGEDVKSCGLGYCVEHACGESGVKPHKYEVFMS